MTIGEMFINLGIKGTEKTVGAISSVTKGLGEAKSMSLETKAAILAAAYAFEKMVTASSQRGMNLKQFADATGLATDKLQHLQNAARQFGVNGEEVTSTVKGIQKSMEDMALGLGSPKALSIMKNFGIDFDPSKALDEKNGPYYAIEKYQELAKKASPALMRSLFPSAGISDNMLGFFRKNTANLFNNNLGPVNSDAMIKKLAAVQVAFLNLSNTFAHLFDKFTSAHGEKLIKDFDNLAKSVFHLIDALTGLAEKFHIFDAISKIINVAANVASNKTGTILDETNIGKRIKDFFLPESSYKDQYSSLPHIKPLFGGGGGEQKNINVQQTLQFNHDGKDHTKNAESHKKSVQSAYRQIQAQGQGS